MGPKAASKPPTTRATTNVSQSEPLGLEGGSQESSVSQYWRDLMQQRKDHTVKRREQRKQNIRKAHHERIAELKAKIAQVFLDHNKRVRALHRPGIQRLIELVREKSDLEASINRCSAELKNAFDSTAAQLQLALEGRFEGQS